MIGWYTQKEQRNCSFDDLMIEAVQLFLRPFRPFFQVRTTEEVWPVKNAVGKSKRSGRAEQDLRKNTRQFRRTSRFVMCKCLYSKVFTNSSCLKILVSSIIRFTSVIAFCLLTETLKGHDQTFPGYRSCPFCCPCRSYLFLHLLL
jgi:hypothetical protein